MTEIDVGAFGRDFLDAYLRSGFGSLPKREIDLLVLQLLLQHHKDWLIQNPPSAFELSHFLRVKQSRIRLLLDELAFKSNIDETVVKQRLKDIILSHESHVDGDRVKIQIEDGYLREYAKNIIRSQYGLVDTSFDRSIVTVSADKFLILATHVADAEAVRVMSLAMTRSMASTKERREGVVRLFVDAMVSSAGQQVGKKAVDLGFAVLSGGISEIPALIDAIKSFKSS